MNKPTFMGNFDSQDGVFDEFKVAAADRVGVNIMFANYDTPSYEGYAFVLFEKDGKLYEVSGSHCSCYGLEEQWSPEETTAEAILYRITENGKPLYSCADSLLNEELVEILKSL